ncbi:putative Glycosyltransferase subfamily 4-like N-terminal domain-containing protein [Candidatus Magnetomoraceae bacterium gMMP-13]
MNVKIIYHHRTLRTGVEGVHISGVINGLKKKGHDVVEVALITGDHNDIYKIPEQSKKTKAGTGKYFKIFAEYFPNFLFRVAELCYNFVGLYKLISTIFKNRDVDFIYDRYAYFSFVPVLIGKIFKIPVILEVNIVTDLKDTRKLELAWLCRVIEQWVVKNCKKVFVISDLLKKTIVKNKGLDKEKIIVQPNGCDLDLPSVDISHIINTKLMEQLDRKTIICFLGRLLLWYNLDKLIEIIAELQNNYPDIVLMIIGDGAEKERLLRCVDEFNQNKNIIFTGRVSHQEAMSLIAHCDLCVIPATNEWTSPVKLFEYMGMGKAVVAPDIKSISSVMSDGVHGRLFKQDDFVEFKKCLATLIKDTKLRETMGQNGRKHIKNNYTWDHVAERIITESKNLI